MVENANAPSRWPAIFWAISCLLVLGALAGGLFLTGGPVHQRKVRMDNQRISDLSSLRYRIAQYDTEHKRLPATLSKLPPSSQEAMADPQTGQPYRYRVTGRDGFELCADFQTDSRPQEGRRNGYYPLNGFPEHPAGAYCYRFIRSADQDGSGSDRFKIQGAL